MGFYGPLWVFMEIGGFLRLKVGHESAVTVRKDPRRVVDKFVICGFRENRKCLTPEVGAETFGRAYFLTTTPLLTVVSLVGPGATPSSARGSLP